MLASIQSVLPPSGLSMKKSLGLLPTSTVRRVMARHEWERIEMSPSDVSNAIQGHGQAAARIGDATVTGEENRV